MSKMADGFRLGVDFGTSNTAAVLAAPDGTIAPLLFDGAPLLPSAVYADQAGLLVGRDALYAARASPERFEAHPKRCVDDGMVLLGEAEVPVVDLIAAVLGRVASEARRVAGVDLHGVTLTHPAGWRRYRRQVLTTAAELAGLGPVELVAEPVAAASYFMRLSGGQLAVGACLVVYDFGAGTFDASVVRRTEDGFTVLDEEGLPGTGGLEVDAAVMAYLAATYAARDLPSWQRLAAPTTVDDRRASRQLWDDVRAAKEMLSRAPSAMIHIPVLRVDVPLGREQFDHLARPVLDQTVSATRAVINESGIQPGEIAGVFLVGGSSRIPLAATLLHRALQIAPTTIGHPELVVAEGSLRVPAAAQSVAAQPVAARAEVAAPDLATAPTELQEPEALDLGGAVSATPRRSRGRVGLTATVIGVLVVALCAGVLWRTTHDGVRDGGSDPGANSSTAAKSSAAAQPGACVQDYRNISAGGTDVQEAAIRQLLERYVARCHGNFYFSTSTGTEGLDGFLSARYNVFFSATPLKADDLVARFRARCGNGAAASLPLVAGAIVVVYRLDGVADLRLGPATLLKIFAGQIKRWDDPAIKADNPGVALPSIATRTLFVSSELTEVFRSYLLAASGLDGRFDFNGSGGGLPHPGDVLSNLDGINGSIGFLEMPDAKGRATVKLRNAAGEWIAPAAQSVAGTLADLADTGTGDGLALATRSGSPTPGGYPAVMVTSAVLCQTGNDPSHLPSIKSFLSYALDAAGQAELVAIGYQPLPEPVRAKTAAAVHDLA